MKPFSEITLAFDIFHYSGWVRMYILYLGYTKGYIILENGRRISRVSKSYWLKAKATEILRLPGKECQVLLHDWLSVTIWLGISGFCALWSAWKYGGSYFYSCQPQILRFADFEHANQFHASSCVGKVDRPHKVSPMTVMPDEFSRVSLLVSGLSCGRKLSWGG